MRRIRSSLISCLALVLVLAPAAFVQTPGEVLWERKISATKVRGPQRIEAFDQFGSAVAAIGDLDGEGVVDLAVGSPGDDDESATSSPDYGGLWILFMQRDGKLKSSVEITRSSAALPLDPGDEFGRSVRELGDFDLDGIPDLLVGAPRDDDGGTDQGALYLLFMNREGTIHSWKKISQTAGGFGADLDPDDQFGRGARCIGDLDQDGVPDIGVGAIHDDDGGTNRGAYYILFMKRDGGVKGWSKLSDTRGNFLNPLSDRGEFGSDCALLGDRNMDGVQDIAIGAPDQSTGGLQQGAVFVVFLNANGTAKSDFLITESYAGFDGDMLDHDDEFGGCIDAIGDLDGDGHVDLAVGAGRDDDGPAGSVDRGAIYVLSLKANCTVKGWRKISRDRGRFLGDIDDQDGFGTSLACPGDLNGDGIEDLFAGARFDDDGGSSAGAVYFLALNDGRVTPPPGGFKRVTPKVFVPTRGVSLIPFVR